MEIFFFSFRHQCKDQPPKNITQETVKPSFAYTCVSFIIFRKKLKGKRENYLQERQETQHEYDDLITTEIKARNANSSTSHGEERVYENTNKRQAKDRVYANTNKRQRQDKMYANTNKSNGQDKVYANMNKINGQDKVHVYVNTNKRNGRVKVYASKNKSNGQDKLYDNPDEC